MDWPRAKSILIILFIALNVFLFTNIIYDRRGSSMSKEALANIELILGDRAVRFSPQCKVPKNSGESYKIEYEKGSFDKIHISEKVFGNRNVSPKTNLEETIYQDETGKLVFTGDNSLYFLDEHPSDAVNLKDEAGTEKYIRKFISRMGINISKYIRDGYATNGSQAIYTFTEKYMDFLIYDNRVEVVVSPKGVTSVKFSYYKIVNFERSSRQIMPVLQVLLKNSAHISGSTIHRIDLGYTSLAAGMEEGSSQLILKSPVWRVTLDGGKEKYFNALDGEELTNVYGKT